MDREQIQRIKETYQPGVRIRLVSMDRESQMPLGMMGQVTFVDDIGQIHVAWENGSSLALICEVDQFIAFIGPTAAEYLCEKYPTVQKFWFREELPGCCRAINIDIYQLIKEVECYAERIISITKDLAVAIQKPYDTVTVFDAYLSSHVLSDENARQLMQKSEFSKEESQAETCPKCGNKQLDYGEAELMEASNIYYPWDCKACGSKGKEYGTIVFDGHEVTDYPDFES